MGARANIVQLIALPGRRAADLRSNKFQTLPHLQSMYIGLNSTYLQFKSCYTSANTFDLDQP